MMQSMRPLVLVAFAVACVTVEPVPSSTLETPTAIVETVVPEVETDAPDIAVPLPDNDETGETGTAMETGDTAASGAEKRSNLLLCVTSHLRGLTL